MHSDYTGVICCDAVVTMEAEQVVLDPHQAFQTQSVDVFCE